MPSIAGIVVRLSQPTNSTSTEYVLSALVLISGCQKHLHDSRGKETFAFQYIEPSLQVKVSVLELNFVCLYDTG
jgi:hypothetical protein